MEEIHVYYKYSSDDTKVYYTNENKDGYRIGTQGYHVSTGREVIIQLYNGKFILPRDSEELFYGATNRSFDYMTSGDTSYVTNMQSLFQDCELVTSLNVSSFNTSNVTNMAAMFSGCYKLVTIYGLEEFDTHNVTTMSGMFSLCSQLTNNGTRVLDLSAFDMRNVVYVDHMFGNCSSLREIVVGENTDGTQYPNMAFSSNLFQGCTGLGYGDGTMNSYRANNTTDNGYFSAGNRGKKYTPYEKTSEGGTLVDMLIRHRDEGKALEVGK